MAGLGEESSRLSLYSYFELQKFSRDDALRICAVLKTLHSVKHILNEEDYRSVGKARGWRDELAVVIVVKGAVQETLGVLEEYKEDWWYDTTAARIKMLSELYQEKFVTEDEVKRMKGERGILSDRVVFVQCTQPPEVVAGTTNVLDKYGHNWAARRLRALNELFTRQLLTAEECSAVAEKGKWEWEVHLTHVLSVKPAEEVQIACLVLEKHGYHVKEELKTLNELFTRHLLTAEECSEVARKGELKWEDCLTHILSTKPAEVVQEASQVLEKHSCHVQSKLKMLSKLYQAKLVTEDEVERMKGGRLSDRVVHVQCTKPPEVVARTANVLDKHRHVGAASLLRALNELFTRQLLTAEECSAVAEKGKWEWEVHLTHVLSVKPAEEVQIACLVLEKHGYPLEEELKTLNELFTGHLLTAEECSEVARKGEWEDHLALVLSTKPAEVVQKACQMLEKHGCLVKKLKMLSELYQEKLVTEDEVERMKGGRLSDRVVHIQSTKPPEVVARTDVVLGKYGYIRAANLRGKAPMTCRRVHGKHLGLRGDLGYRGLSTASTDLGYGGSSTASTDLGYEGSSAASTDLGYGSSSTAFTDLGYGGSSTASTDSEHRGLSTVSTDLGYGGLSTASTDLGYGGLSTASTDLGYRGLSTAATSTHSTSHLVESYQKMSMHSHEGSSQSQPKLSSKKVEGKTEHQGSKVLSQFAEEESGPPKEPDSAVVKGSETPSSAHPLIGTRQTAPNSKKAQTTSTAAAVESPGHPELGIEPVFIKSQGEVLLKELCYMATGIQQLHVGPGGGTFTLGCSDTTLKVPPGALEREISVHYAIILHGPFVFSTSYKPGSVVVYVNMDGATLVKPVCLSLSHWCSREKKGGNTLKFIRAPHVPDAQKKYFFKELEEGDFTTYANVGMLTILEPQCLYCVEMKNEEVARYNLLTFQKNGTSASTLIFRIQLMCDSKEWNKTVEGALQKIGWSSCSSGVATFSFAAGESDQRKTITACPVDAKGPGWISTIDGHQLVSEDSFLKLKNKTQEEFEGEVSSGRFPPYVHYKLLYTSPKERRPQPSLMMVDLKGSNENLRLSFDIMEEALVPSLPSPPQQTPINPRDLGAATPLLPPTLPPPDTADIIRALNHQLDAKWRHFGTFLRVDYQTMDTIRLDNGGKQDDCMLDLLGRWTSNQAGTGTLPRNWQTVVEAVKETGFRAIAENLAEMHGLTLSQ